MDLPLESLVNCYALLIRSKTQITKELFERYEYKTKGEKFISITAWNFGTKCSSSFKDTITIAEPQAKFSVTPVIGCYALDVNFTNSSIDADSVTWDFGDNTFSTLANPLKVYTSQNIFTIKLVIITAEGCRDSTLQTINLSAKPVVLYCLLSS